MEAQPLREERLIPSGSSREAGNEGTCSGLPLTACRPPPLPTPECWSSRSGGLMTWKMMIGVLHGLQVARKLLKPIFPGSIPSIRRNFHNLVLFIDPAQEYTLDFIKLVDLFYSHEVPLRIGFVFILNTDDEVDGANDAGVALWRAFNYIAEEFDKSEAFISIVHMYQKVKKDQNILTVDNVKSVLQNAFPHANIWDILGIHSKYDEERLIWQEQEVHMPKERQRTAGARWVARGMMITNTILAPLLPAL
nr:UDP-glucose:glycoprotein glucosyltransferase 2-like [Symphalangus syndactylus]